MNRDGETRLAEVEWSLEASQDGTPVLRLAGRDVDSRYAPKANAARAAERILEDSAKHRADLVIVIGTGLGYLIDALARDRGPDLLVWDPFPLLREQLERDGVRLPRARADGPCLEIVRSATSFDAVLARLARTHRRPQLVIHPGYEAVARFEARHAARELRRCFSGNEPTRVESCVVSERSLQSLRQLPLCRTIDDLSGTLDGQTAIIVSTGLSILPACKALSRRGGGALFAGVQALRRLAQHEVHINFATCADPADLFERRRVPDDVRYDALLADTSSHPDMLAPRLGRTFLYHLRTPHVHQVAWERCGLPTTDEPCLTISEISLLLALRLGARRFVLVGVDYDADDPRYSERFNARNLSGVGAPTNSHYFQGARYLDSLCPRLAAQGIELFRFSRGLPISGTRTIDEQELADLLADLPACRVPAPSIRLSADRLRASRKILRRLASPSSRAQDAGSSGRDAAQFGDDFAPLEPNEIGKRSRAMLHSLDAAAQLFEGEPDQGFGSRQMPPSQASTT
ncbi:MAG: hypothetical protein GY944_17135 [bacterium]|nr:hypothetical protein [bacterium]